MRVASNSLDETITRAFNSALTAFGTTYLPHNAQYFSNHQTVWAWLSDGVSSASYYRAHTLLFSAAASASGVWCIPDGLGLMDLAIIEFILGELYVYHSLVSGRINNQSLLH